MQGIRGKSCCPPSRKEDQKIKTLERKEEIVNEREGEREESRRLKKNVPLVDRPKQASSAPPPDSEILGSAPPVRFGVKLGIFPGPWLPFGAFGASETNPRVQDG